MRRLSLVILMLALASPAAAAPRLTVALDHSERLYPAGPAGSVIVGNPAVADVTVVDQRTLYVSGRGYGTTEIVVLGPRGDTVWKGEVVVTAPEGQVSIYRGAQVTEMACGSTCSPSGRTGGAAAAGAKP
jgi:Flp pilus assembly secretin CpaC